MDTLSFTQEITPTNMQSYTSEPIYSEVPAEAVPVEVATNIPVEQPTQVIPEIFAYVREVVPCNNDASSNDLSFDIILNASAQGKSGTVIKRIKLCKTALFQELMTSCEKQGTYVESKQEDKSELKRFRELAGISHPKNYV